MLLLMAAAAAAADHASPTTRARHVTGVQRSAAAVGSGGDRRDR
jgi:hypothetical protein